MIVLPVRREFQPRQMLSCFIEQVTFTSLSSTTKEKIIKKRNKRRVDVSERNILFSFYSMLYKHVLVDQR